MKVTFSHSGKLEALMSEIASFEYEPTSCKSLKVDFPSLPKPKIKTFF